MDVISARVCGLDVHQDTVVACILVGEPGLKVRREVRTFGTVTRELGRLAQWLREEKVTAVAMESTGVYWIPVFVALEDEFTLVVGNAMHIKNVPGRKTDVKDSEWIAQLLRHGLIRPSYVPPKELRGLRELVRQRRKLVLTQASLRNRILKVLEQGGIKISTFVTDVFGVSGRQFLRALIAGNQAPADMAQLAKGRLRSKLANLELALEGRLSEHFRFIVEVELNLVEEVEKSIAKIDERIQADLLPYADEVALLKQIPGLDDIAAAAIIGEMGVDMSIFSSVRHAAAWAGVCPGNNRSAGKAKRETTRSGNVHLTTTLVQVALNACRKKGSYLRSKYHRLKARRGAKRALMALAHKILIAAYHMLRDRAPYKDLGEAYLDTSQRSRTAKMLRKRLEAMGFAVDLTDSTVQATPA